MTAPGAAADTLAALEPVHPLLVTPRLALRRFRADDLEFLCRLNADPDVTRHTGGTKDRAQTEQMLRVRVIDYYQANPGLGIWATIERDTGDDRETQAREAAAASTVGAWLKRMSRRI